MGEGDRAEVMVAKEVWVAVEEARVEFVAIGIFGAEGSLALSSFGVFKGFNVAGKYSCAECEGSFVSMVSRDFRGIATSEDAIESCGDSVPTSFSANFGISMGGRLLSGNGSGRG